MSAVPTSSADIRSAYLSFFEARGHRRVPSSRLVPLNDPSLTFTNSGMVQFKEALIGTSNPGYTRATSAQRCVRAGGKHNDLDNVGYTLRHHTFFEMLGNFSFGDYFKEDAIKWAWEFVTQVLDLPIEALWFTVHPEDEESRRLWLDKPGVGKERVIDHGENFWTMGDVGPCGPCSEIFFDHGPALAGGPPGSEDEDGDRYVEIWNLVFPQFDRSPDGTLTALKRPGVDTGMGLERVAAVRQGVHSNYQTDGFTHLMNEVADLLPKAPRDQAPLRVIADHIRSTAFLVCDGVVPSNEDRGYVLRRIIRRALRYGYQCGAREPFFHALVAPLAESLGDAYAEIRDHRAEVESVLLREEVRFSRTLDSGMQMLDKVIEDLSGKEIPGSVVFKLYDTYGFPPDLTADFARGRGLGVDFESFEGEMRAQRERARKHSRYTMKSDQRVTSDQAVEFTGYTNAEDDARVLDIFGERNGDLASVDVLREGEQGIVLLDRTPFYAESGGQIGDQGHLLSGEARFAVGDTRKGGDQCLHDGRMTEGNLRVGDQVRAQIDADRRERIRRNHSATHLLHAALREVLGEQVVQKGSLVAQDRLRFDFSHHQQVTQQELGKIEALVNERIRENSEVLTRLTSFDEALDAGAIALFGERYGDQVRVLDMGNGFSVELCGGTHVSRTGDIGLVKIIAESAISAGVRRIEAVSGEGAYEWVVRTSEQVDSLRRLLKVGANELYDKTQTLLRDRAQLGKSLESSNARMAEQIADRLASRAKQVRGVWVLAADMAEEPSSIELRSMLDLLQSRLEPSVIVLAESNGDKARLVAGRTAGCEQVSARDVLARIGKQTGARGGGRDDFAQSGGADSGKLAQALEDLPDWVGEQF